MPKNREEIERETQHVSSFDFLIHFSFIFPMLALGKQSETKKEKSQYAVYKTHVLYIVFSSLSLPHYHLPQ